MSDLPPFDAYEEPSFHEPVLEDTNTWTRLGQFAEDAEAASEDLQTLVNQRLDALVTNFIDEIGRIPEGQQNDPEVYRSVLEGYMTTLREDLEESFVEMDHCLKGEVRARVLLERKGRMHEMIHKLGTALLEDRSFRDLSRLVSEECTQLLCCQSTYVFVTDRDGQVLSGGGYQSTRFSSMEILIVPVVQEVLRLREPKLVDDPRDRSRTTCRR